MSMTLRSGKVLTDWAKISKEIGEHNTLLQAKLENNEANRLALQQELQTATTAISRLLEDLEAADATIVELCNIVGCQTAADAKIFLNATQTLLSSHGKILKVKNINDLDQRLLEIYKENDELTLFKATATKAAATSATASSSGTASAAAASSGTAPVVATASGGASALVNSIKVQPTVPATSTLTATTTTTTGTVSVAPPGALSPPTHTASTSVVVAPVSTSSLVASTSTPTRFKRAPIPPFSGKRDENVSQWLFLLECHFKADKVPDSEKPLIAVGYLRDLALEFYRRLAHDNEPSWSELRAALLEQFQPFDMEQSVRRDLLQLKQTRDVDFNTYLQKFLKLVNQTYDMVESDKISYFKNGLHPKTSEEIQIRRPKTLKEAIEIATAHDQRFSKYQTPNNTNNHNNNHNRARFDQNKHKHNRSHQIECYSCKEVGHTSNNCPNKAKPSATQKPLASNMSGGNHFKKGKPQHIAMMTNVTPPECLLTVKSIVNDHPCTLVLDTAANISILSQSFVSRNKITTHPCRSILQTASLQPTEVTAQTNNLAVEVHHSLAHMKFMVHALPANTDGLLGLDWFRQTNSFIDTTERVLTFKARDVCLDNKLDTKDTVTLDCLVSESILEEEELDQDQTWLNTPDERDPETLLETIDMSGLSVSQSGQIRQLILSNFDAFAHDYKSIGCCTFGEHEIVLTVTKPIFLYPYRKSGAEREAIKVEIQRMIDANIIRPSRSPWSFPVVLIRKKDGSVRFCVDYRKLNTVTVQDPYPIPRIDDILDRLTGSTWYTTLDLKSGYWQIRMHRDSIAYTAFSTPDGHYEFLRLPFGLRNAPAFFSSIMYQLLGDLPFVEIYIDDLTIHSNRFELHLEHLSIVISRLVEANLKINFEKCVWFQNKIEILGHIVSGNTVQMNIKKILAIKEMKPPKNFKDLQRFIGVTNFYRKYVQNYGAIVFPLTKLLRKDTEWKWDTTCQTAFETLKNKLIEYPVLRQPDFSKPFKLYTDASSFALGAILAQTDEASEYVCAYASRILKGAEVHYGITEKECLAVVWAIKHFRVYLYGTHFTVITDHSALTWLMSITDPTGRLARWSLYLQSYDFSIVHRPGSKHANVDALSRPVLLAASLGPQDDDNDISIKLLDPYDNGALLQYLKHGRHQPGSSKNVCKRVEKLACHYIFQNDKLFYAPKPDKAHVEVPKVQERYALVQQAHLLGHFQAQSTLDRLREHYYWPKINTDVEHFIENCLVCKRHQHKPAKDHPAMALPITGIFDRVGIDLVLGLPVTTDGYKGIMVITEYLSKYPYAVPITSKTASEIAQKLFHYISLFGPPKELLSDQGKEFLNSVVDHLSKISGIQHQVTAPYHPRTNGLTERFNQTLINALRKHTEDDPQQWHLWIPYILLAYRTRIHSTTGYTPFELLFGRPMNSFHNWQQDKADTDEAALLKRALELRCLVEDLQPQVVKNLQTKQERQKRIQDSQNNIQKEPLVVGSTVYIQTQKLQGKLQPRNHGPYTVMGRNNNGNYILENRRGVKLRQTYPLAHLLPVTEDPEGESYEVERILDHRLRRGKMEYFIKWKDYPDECNEWKRETDFDTTEIIEEYWQKLHKPQALLAMSTPQIIDTPLTPQIINWYVNCLQRCTWILPILICIWFFTPAVNATTIEGPFQFCDSSNKMLVSTKLPCKTELSTTKSTGTWHIYTRRRHKVDGPAIVCTKTLITVTSHVSFFAREKSLKRSETPQFIDERACKHMWDTRLCDGQPMACFGNNCKYQVEPVPEYAWSEDIPTSTVKCEMTQRRLTAEHADSIIATTKLGPCRPEDMYCYMDGSTMLWDKSIIHDCPYAYIQSGSFIQSGDIIYTTPGAAITVNQTARHLLFQLLQPIQACGMTLYSTSENFYVANMTNAALMKDPAELDVQTIQYYTLADDDFTSFDINETLLKLQVAMTEQLCYLFQTVLRFFMGLQTSISRLITITDQTGVDIVLLLQNGNLYLPSCRSVPALALVTQTTNCYADYPVKIANGADLVSAFLTPSGIVKRSSATVSCNQTLESAIHNKYWLTRLSNGSTVVHKLNENSLFQLKPRAIQAHPLDFQHDPHFQVNIDVLDQLERATSILDSHHTFQVVRDDVVQPPTAFIKFLGLQFPNWHDVYIKLVIILSIIVVIIILTIFLCCCCKARRSDSKLTDVMLNMMSSFRTVTPTTVAANPITPQAALPPIVQGTPPSAALAIIQRRRTHSQSINDSRRQSMQHEIYQPATNNEDGIIEITDTGVHYSNRQSSRQQMQVPIVPLHYSTIQQQQQQQS